MACCGRLLVQILRAESLKSRNTLSLQANVEALAMVSSEQELEQALSWARAQGLRTLAMGQGSNIVLAGDLEVLAIRQLNEVISVLAEEEDKVTLRVSAGHDWHSLVTKSLQAGYYGLENLALIPGTVGAAPIQNIGAYGVEFEHFVLAVHGYYTQTGEAFSLRGDECRFAYRDSIFKHALRDQTLITAVDIRLSRSAKPSLGYPALQEELARRGVEDPQPGDVFAAVVDVRRRRLPDPESEPNAGSFFKNPLCSAAQARALHAHWPEMPSFEQPGGAIKIPAAWLIEKAGWKGRRKGGVGVHPGHALVLVNYGSDSGQELLALAESIRESVRREYDIELELEPRVYGAPE